MQLSFTKLRVALLVLAVSALPFLYSSSSGCKTSALAPPAPPAEIPAPVTLKAIDPSDLSISIDAISPSVTESISSWKAVDPGGEHSDLITSGFEMVSFTEEYFFFPALQSISDWGIPISKDTKCLQETVTFSTETGFLAGVHEMTAVFSVPIDFDGDGNFDDCSGNTTHYTDEQWADGNCTTDELNDGTCEPRHDICGMIWMGGARYLVWKWTDVPVDDDAETEVNEATIGNGQFKLFIEELNGFSVELMASYGEERPLDEDPSETNTSQFLENYVRARNNYSTVFSGYASFINDILEYNWHQDISSRGPDEEALKLINLNNYFDFYDITTSTDLGYGRAKYIGQWREDNIYWSGRSDRSGEVGGTPVYEEEPTVCALLQNGVDVSLGFCDEANIVTSDIPFTEDFAGEDVSVPGAFLDAPDTYIDDPDVCPNLF